MDFRTTRCLLPALALFLCAAAPWNAAADTSLQQALGAQTPVWKAPAADLLAAVKQCAAKDPAHAGLTVRMALSSGRTDADALAPQLVTAAIQGLGRNPHEEWIKAIVCGAVKAAPTEVLQIVPAAIKSSPRSAAKAIVAGAAISVPDPQKKVTMESASQSPSAVASLNSNDGKDTQDGNQLAAATNSPESMAIAEAIVQAAVNADPGLSASDLTAAVDSALADSYATVKDPVLTEVLAPTITVPVDPPLPGTFGIGGNDSGVVSQ